VRRTICWHGLEVLCRFPLVSGALFMPSNDSTRAYDMSGKSSTLPSGWIEVCLTVLWTGSNAVWQSNTERIIGLTILTSRCSRGQLLLRDNR